MTTRTAAALAIATRLLASWGCNDEKPTVVVVTVDARPSVFGVTRLEATVFNQEASASDTFELDELDFPVSFSVTPTNREGTLRVEVRGVDETDITRATGVATAEIVPQSRVDVDLLLEPSDFVVNTSVAGTQKLTFVSERTGRQVAVAPDDSFLVTFVNDCTTLGRCDVFARLFHPDSSPAANDITNDSNEFIANLSDEFAAIPAVAISDSAIFVAWETNSDVRGVALTLQAGHVGFSETIISTTDEWHSDPSVAALGSGDFVVVWSETDTTAGGNVIRGRLLTAAGDPRTNPITYDNNDFPVSTATGASYQLPSVVGTGQSSGFAVVWRDDNNLFARFFDSTGAPQNAGDVALTTHDTGAEVFGPNVAWWNASVVVVWGIRDLSSSLYADGAYVLRRFLPESGDPETPVRILSPTTNDRFSAPDVAVHESGTIGATWHHCGSSGDGSGCGVFFQALRPSGLPIGAPRVANSTTLGDQTGPSIAARSDGFLLAWSDASEQPPDTVDGSVRARLLFPEMNPNDGRLGARCGQPADAPCASGLVCMPGTSGTPYCHEECDRSQPEPQCPKGGVCTTFGETTGCLF